MTDQSLPESGVARAAQDVASLAALRADRAEEDRRLTADVVRAIVAAGFARHFVPADHGGSAGTFTELSAAITVVGARCAAAAWSASLMANLARMAAYLPEEGRKEVWKDGPDTVIVGGVSPVGRAHAEGDGWRLSGKWPYISVVDHSDWALVSGVVRTGAGYEPRLFALPREVYTVDGTWSDIGMRATGSNTLVADDVFVPATLSFPVSDLHGREAAGPVSPCHAVPLQAVNGLSFCLPILGAAEGALEYWSAYAAQKIRSWSPARPGPGPGPGFYEEVLARCSGEIDAARLLLERVARVADKGTGITPVETARSQRDCALSADLLVGAVNRLFRASGTAGHSDEQPLQRIWRDVNSAAGHVVLQFGPCATAYADRVLDRSAGRHDSSPAGK
ncbi:acyl-CoA dehydrogenase family protein [Streptomyces olivaceus]|uniref:acyl-CoA dehydrogenase family protein n=1 Tax=Streptomyces olivaceus TaxID=47716 RepID=UPI001CCF3CA9|nr:acyl-CoA dehydrogenase family protein [Streptomyces olivaceus]MBZ6295933.1 hydrolase [Streptomyces olivaceus]MBZ6330911.1 hydrolase [Streptomyces olivaceus]